MKLQPKHEAVLDGLSKTRCALPETIQMFLEGDTLNAARKRAEQMAASGWLVTSLLPSGRQWFRQSKLGCKHTGSPACWCESPAAGVIAEALAAGAVMNISGFNILRPADVARFLQAAALDESLAIPSRVMASRFVRTEEQNGDLRLNYLLAEIRPAAKLAQRAKTVLHQLGRIPVFDSLIRSDLLGLIIAVPTDGVRATLVLEKFAVPVRVIVVEELRHLTL
jgi:hypothetical protein